MNLLAKSCFSPGLIALVSNLISSSSDLEGWEEVWMSEYWTGMGHEIYRIQLNTKLEGKYFKDIVKIIYMKSKAIVFGLELTVVDTKFEPPDKKWTPTKNDPRNSFTKILFWNKKYINILLMLLLKWFKYLFSALLNLSVFYKIHDQFDSTYLQFIFLSLICLKMFLMIIMLNVSPNVFNRI